MTLSTQPRVAIVGAGALGSYVGARLSQGGLAVRLVARAAQAEAITRGGLQLRTAAGMERVDVRVDTNFAAVQDAELVLVCVKSADTASVAAQLAPWLAADAVLLSLQNGVENAAVLAAQVRQPLVIGLAYLAAALTAPGVVQHFGGAELVIGAESPAAQAELGRLAEVLRRGGFSLRVSPQPRLELWNKLIVNCAWNAISALAQAPYGLIATLAPLRELQAAVVREAVAVAQADGLAVSLPALQAAVDRIALAMPQQLSSTAQDLARGRASEIDHLNGCIVRRGAERGLATPVNQALWALVKLQEAQRAATPRG